MNFRRLATALVVALLLSGAVTFFLSRKLTSHNAHSTVQRYVAPSRSLQAGEVLKPEDLALVEWPASMPLSGAFGKIGDLGRPGGDLSGGCLAAYSRWIPGGAGIGDWLDRQDSRRHARHLGEVRRGGRCGRLSVSGLACGCAGHLPFRPAFPRRRRRSSCRTSRC